MALGIAAVALIALLSVVGKRLSVAPQLILVLVGVGLSFVPGTERLALDPEIVMMGLLPLLLYASALGMSTVEFRRDLGPIAALAALLVVLTAVVLGWAVHKVEPEIPLGVAIALGALLSPTDAAATGVVKGLGLSPRVLAILNGESLLNDASALVLLRSALAAGAVGLSAWGVTKDFVYAALMAYAIGTVVGLCGVWLRARIDNTVAATAVSLLVPFVAFLPADLVHASGLVAVVAAGIASLRRGPHSLSATQRMTERANWDTIEFLAEGAVFLLMGLQMKGLVTDLSRSSDGVSTALVIGACGIVATLVIRGVFLTGVLAVVARRTRRKTQVRDQWQEHARAVRERIDELAPVQPDGTRGNPDTQALLRQARELAGTTASGPHKHALHLAHRTGLVARLFARRGPDQHPDTVHTHAHAFGRHQPEALRVRFERMRDAVRRYLADVEYLNREPLHAREGVLLTWAGMRGVVTVAAAQTLPLDTPHRPLLVAIAFTVAAGSLILQGGTLPFVVRWLGLAGRDTAPEGEREHLDAELAAAGSALLDDPDLCQADGTPYDPTIVRTVRARVGGVPGGAAPATPQGLPAPPAPHVRPEAAHTGDDDPANGLASPVYDGAQPAALAPADAQRQFTELRLACLDAMREQLLKAQSIGAYTSATLRARLAELDADEISLQVREDASSE